MPSRLPTPCARFSSLDRSAGLDQNRGTMATDAKDDLASMLQTLAIRPAGAPNGDRRRKRRG